MVISATTFSGGVTNAGTIGAGGVTVISSTFLTGGFLNSNLISGAPTGIAVLSDSTIHGAIVDTGRIVAEPHRHPGQRRHRFRRISRSPVIGTISAGSSAVVVRNAATFGAGISNSGTVAATSGAGILVRNITAFGNGSASGIGNSRVISAKLTGIAVETMGAFFGSISNSGTISTGGAGILIDEIAEVTSGIANSGTISAHGSGIIVELVANFSGGVANRGMILAAGDTGIGFDADAVVSGDVDAGTIRAARTGIAAITVSSFAGSITNNGTLSAGAVGIRLGSATIPQQYTVSSFSRQSRNRCWPTRHPADEVCRPARSLTQRPIKLQHGVEQHLRAGGAFVEARRIPPRCGRCRRRRGRRSSWSGQRGRHRRHRGRAGDHVARFEAGLLGAGAHARDQFRGELDRRRIPDARSL